MSDDLRKLLQASDLPRDPAPDELARISAAVFGEDAATREFSLDPNAAINRPAEADDAIVLQFEPSGESSHGVLWFRAVASLIVIVGAITVAIAASGPRQDTASTVPPIACTSVPNVVHALEAWRGVDNWAQLSETEPDLGFSVLLVVRQLEDGPDVQRAVSQLEAISGRNDVGRDVAVRRQAVVDGIDVIIARLDAFDDPEACDLTVLRMERP